MVGPATCLANHSQEAQGTAKSARDVASKFPSIDGSSSSRFQTCVTHILPGVKRICTASDDLGSNIRNLFLDVSRIQIAFGRVCNLSRKRDIKASFVSALEFSNISTPRWQFQGSWATVDQWITTRLWYMLLFQDWCNFFYSPAHRLSLSTARQIGRPHPCTLVPWLTPREANQHFLISTCPRRQPLVLRSPFLPCK